MGLDKPLPGTLVLGGLIGVDQAERITLPATCRSDDRLEVRFATDPQVGQPDKRGRLADVEVGLGVGRDVIDETVGAGGDARVKLIFAQIVVGVVIRIVVGIIIVISIVISIIVHIVVGIVVTVIRIVVVVVVETISRVIVFEEAAGVGDGFVLVAGRDGTAARCQGDGQKQDREQ